MQARRKEAGPEVHVLACKEQLSQAEAVVESLKKRITESVIYWETLGQVHDHLCWKETLSQ